MMKWRVGWRYVDPLNAEYDHEGEDVVVATSSDEAKETFYQEHDKVCWFVDYVIEVNDGPSNS